MLLLPCFSMSMQRTHANRPCQPSTRPNGAASASCRSLLACTAMQHVLRTMRVHQVPHATPPAGWLMAHAHPKVRPACRCYRAAQQLRTLQVGPSLADHT